MHRVRSKRPASRSPGEINAGAYVLERSVLELIPPGQNVSIELDVFPRLIGDGLHALLLDGYWMDIGTPERYLQASWDILEGDGQDRGRADLSRRARRRRRGGRRGRGGRAARGRLRRAAGSMPARRSANRSCSTAPRSARAHGSAARSSRPAPRSGPEMIVEGAIAGRREKVAGLRPTMLEDVLAIPDHLRDALWRVESARIAPADSAGLFVCGMGGSAIGGDLAAAALGDRLRAAAADDPRLPRCRAGRRPSGRCSARATRARPRRPSPASRPPASSARRRIVASTGGALVEPARARPSVPVIGLPGLLPAPRAGVAYMLVCRRRGRRAGRRRTQDRGRDRGGRRLSRASAPRTSRSRAGEIAAALEGRSRSSTAPI